MRNLIVALIYTAIAATANADTSQLEALKSGSMEKLRIHTSTQPGSDIAFLKVNGSETTLAAYEGKVVVLNFWATWCAPCRKEMPHLSKLQSQLGGDDFAVVTVATGRNSLQKMEKFFADIGINNLPLYRDPKMALSRDMGVMPLPTTVILNRDGQEIARMQGDADWSSDSALAILTTIIND